MELNVGTIIFIILMIFCTYIAIWKKKTYLYVFVFLYPILPEYFSINIKSSLPLLTGARCLFILLILNTIINKINFKELKDHKFSLKYICRTIFDFKCLKDTKFWIPLLVLFVGETINFISHIDVKENYKEYFKVIVENILFVVIILMNINTDERKEKSIKSLVYASGVVFIFSIIEPFINMNLAEFLDTGATDTVLKITFYRLNIRRATFTFGHPIALSVYAVILIPLIIYCMNKYNKWIYKVIFILGIWTILFTLTRAQIIIIIVMLIMMFFFMKKENRKQYLLISFTALISACMINIKIIYVFLNIVYSFINMFGYNFKVKDFGDNENAFTRIEQFSMVQQVTEQIVQQENQKMPKNKEDNKKTNEKTNKNVQIVNNTVNSKNKRENIQVSDKTIEKNEKEVVNDKEKISIRGYLVGGGEKYIARNKTRAISISKDRTYRVTSIDCQYVEWIINKGILGLLYNIFVYAYLAKIFITLKNKTELSKGLFFTVISIIFMYLATCQLTTNRITWLIICILLVEIFYNKEKNTKRVEEK